MSGIEAAIGEHRQLPRQIRRHDAPSTAPAPRSAARSTTSSAILRRLERGVDRADDVEQRVAPLDAAAQRALEHAQPGRPRVAGPRRRAMQRTRDAASIRSCRRADGAMQRGRHPRGSTRW